MFIFFARRDKWNRRTRHVRTRNVISLKLEQFSRRSRLNVEKSSERSRSYRPNKADVIPREINRRPRKGESR